MKKIYFFISICFFLTVQIERTFAQTDSTLKKISNTEDSVSKNIIRTANDLKSGNSLDLLTNFFQLAASDITGANHSFSFKSTLFALKVKADSSLLIDTNYVKQKFSRNFQFNFDLKFDSNYHFNGFNGGFTWSIVNKRDASVVQFINNYSEQFDTTLDHSIEAFQISLLDKDKKISDENLELFNRTKDSIKSMLKQHLFSVSRLPKEFQVFVSKDLESLYTKQDSLFKTKLDEIAKQPLVTLSANGNFDNVNSKLNGGNAGVVWLQGFKSKAYKEGKGKGTSCESDFRLTGNTKDTMLNNSSIRRTIAGGTWGINIMAIHNNKSIVEFKPNLEYSHVFHGMLSDEKKDKFYANADLRIRITGDLWVPLTIKYDVKKGNFLGFLNVSLNMNAFKSSK